MATPRILSLFKKARATITGLALTAIGAAGAQAADFTHAEEGYAFPEKGQGVWSVTEDANAQYGLNLKFTDVLEASGLKKNSVIHADTKIVLPGLAEKIAADKAEAERVADAARIEAARQAEIQRLAAQAEAERLAAIEAEKIEDARIAAELKVQKDEAEKLLANANSELSATQKALNDAKAALEKAEAEHAAAKGVVAMEEAELVAAETALTTAQTALATAQATAAATPPAAPVPGTAASVVPAAPVVDPVAVAQADVDRNLQQVGIARDELAAAQTAAFDAGANVTAANSDKVDALVDVSAAEHNVGDIELVFANASLTVDNNALLNQVEAKDDDVAAAAAALAEAQADLANCVQSCPLEQPPLGPKARPADLDVPNEYIVKKGEELCEIAAKLGLSENEIFKANPHAFGRTNGKKDADKLYAGAQLNLEGIEKTDECGCNTPVVPKAHTPKTPPVVAPVVIPTVIAIPDPVKKPTCVEVRKAWQKGLMKNERFDCKQDDGDSRPTPTRPDPKPEPEKPCGTCNPTPETPDTTGSQGGDKGGNQPPGKNDNDKDHGKNGKGSDKGGNKGPGRDDNGPSGPRGPSGDKQSSVLEPNQVRYAGQTFTFTIG